MRAAGAGCAWHAVETALERNDPLRAMQSKEGIIHELGENRCVPRFTF